MIYVCTRRQKHLDDIPMEIEKIFVTHPAPGNWIVNMSIDYKCPKCGAKFGRLIAFDAKKEVLV
jgi:DNA-directed RNA polymerase subunit RPC12/RpoP